MGNGTTVRMGSGNPGAMGGAMGGALSDAETYPDMMGAEKQGGEALDWRVVRREVICVNDVVSSV